MSAFSNIGLEEEDLNQDIKENLIPINEIAAVAENYYDWFYIFPELQVLYDNIDLLLEEALSITQWIDWPEDDLISLGGVADWTVFPFLHTFPATDTSKSLWVKSTNQTCPRTSNLLKSIPGIRTALFSRLGSGTKLSSHTGWADLANYVLRCHICLKIPPNNNCGLVVNNEKKHHTQGEIIVFDDSKNHYAFNDSGEDRIVLIVDLMRPDNIPKGTAVGGHTSELDAFVDRFR